MYNLVQTCSQLYNLVQTCSDWFCLVLSSFKLSRSVLNCLKLFEWFLGCLTCAVSFVILRTISCKNTTLYIWNVLLVTNHHFFPQGRIEPLWPSGKACHSYQLRYDKITRSIRVRGTSHFFLQSHLNYHVLRLVFHLVLEVHFFYATLDLSEPAQNDFDSVPRHYLE